MELEKLTEGLPIKIISGEKVEVDPYVYHRKQVVFNLDSEEVATILGWRVILALMDEAQEEVSVSKDSAEFAKKSRGIPLNISGGEVDEAEQNPAVETSERCPDPECSSTRLTRGVNPGHRICDKCGNRFWVVDNKTGKTSENPFQGPHWDRINEGTGDHSKGLRDLRDEFLRMRGGE